MIKKKTTNIYIYIYIYISANSILLHRFALDDRNNISFYVKFYI